MGNQSSSHWTTIIVAIIGAIGIIGAAIITREGDQRAAVEIAIAATITAEAKHTTPILAQEARPTDTSTLSIETTRLIETSTPIPPESTSINTTFPTNTYTPILPTVTFTPIPITPTPISQTNTPVSTLMIIPTQEMEDMKKMRLIFAQEERKDNLMGMAVIDAQGISDIKWLPLGYDSSISPNGEFVSFHNCFSGNDGIYLSKIDGSEARKIFPVSTQYCIGQLDWSPDGKKLSYTVFGEGHLHIITIDDKVDSPIYSSTGMPFTGHTSWNPSADKIVSETGGGGRRDIHIVDMDGIINQLTTRSNLPDCKDNWFPDWSPDGSQIAFISCGRLYTISPLGTDLQQLKLANSVYNPKWSTDSKWILYRNLTDNSLMRIQRNGKSLVVIDTNIRVARFTVSDMK